MISVRWIVVWWRWWWILVCLVWDCLVFVLDEWLIILVYFCGLDWFWCGFVFFCWLCWDGVFVLLWWLDWWWCNVSLVWCDNLLGWGWFFFWVCGLCCWECLVYCFWCCWDWVCLMGNRCGLYWWYVMLFCLLWRYCWMCVVCLCWNCWRWWVWESFSCVRLGNLWNLFWSRLLRIGFL